jgi:hypothetical protein
MRSVAKHPEISHDIVEPALGKKLRKMKLTDQGGKDVRGLEVKVVIWTVEIRRQDGNEIRPVLPVKRRTQFNPGNLGNGIRFVCRLKRRRKKIFFLHRLGGKPRIDAGAPQEKELLDAVPVRRINHIALNDQVVVNEVSGISVVGIYPAHLGCRQKDVLRPFGIEKCVHVLLGFEIEFVMSFEEQISIPVRLQPP